MRQKENHFFSERGMTLFQFLLAALLLSATILFLFPYFISKTPASKQRKTNELAIKIESESAINFSYINSTQKRPISVRNCQDAKNLFLPNQQWPVGFTILSKVVAPAQLVKCELVYSDGKTTAAFMLWGV